MTVHMYTHIHKSCTYNIYNLLIKSCVYTNLMLQVKGIKGASILCSHRPFDLCTGVVIDVMHCVFLGVIGKGLMKYWFSSGFHGKPFSLRRKVCCMY